MGVGYPDTPGIWSAEQIQGWKKVTDAVHAKVGKIVLQLWHVGRISDPIYLDGQLPVAPSAIKPAGHVSLVRPMKDYETPRALETAEIPGIVEAYRKRCGELRKLVSMGSRFGANGYLLDQFLQASTNQRSDAWVARWKMRPADAGSDRCRHLRVGRRACWRTPCAACRLPSHGRFNRAETWLRCR